MTVDIVKTLEGKYKEIVIVPNVKSPGKGGALRTIFELMIQLSEARALILIDSDLRSITPEWIALLGCGALDYDLVTPVYQRHKYDATITNFIARPLTTMLYGLDIKQPIGGDFGLSRRLVKLLADSPLWTAHPWFYLFGVDIFITHTALANNMKIAEAQLKAKIHEAKDPSIKLGNMFKEVTGALFTLMFEYEDAWSSNIPQSITSPPLLDEPKVPSMKAWEVQVSIENIKRRFMKGLEEFKKYYEKILDKEIVGKLYQGDVVKNGIDSELWIYMLFDYATVYKREYNTSRRIRILESLLPLWQGRLYNYIINVANLDDEEASKIIEMECREYFKRRNDFITKYLG